MTETTDQQAPATTLPWIESPFFEQLLPEMCGTDEERATARAFRDQGFLVLENVFDEALLDRAITETDGLFDPAVPDGPRSRIRVQDGWKESPAVQEIATHPRIIELLRLLYRRRPIPFQTLSFRHSTQQRAHADTIHFHTIPARFMCGVWVALEDVGPENGTLFYYPGSHRLPDYAFEDIGLGRVHPQRKEAFDEAKEYKRYEDFLERLMANHGLARRELVAKKGTVLIWAANLAHGGGPVADPARTRWSQVTHYVFEDCLYYTPMLSSLVTGDLYLRKVVEVGSGEVVPNVYRGLPVEGADEPATVKLLLDADGERDVVRGISNYRFTFLERDMASLEVDVANHRKQIEMLKGSLSYRLGRALTAPLRLFR